MPSQPQRPQQQAGADVHQGTAHRQHQYLLCCRWFKALGNVDRSRQPFHLGECIRLWTRQRADEAGAHARDSTLFQGARIGRCHDLQSMHALVFAMSTHSRLGSSNTPTATGGGSQERSQCQQGKMPAAADKGKDCESAADKGKDSEYIRKPGELGRRVVEACVWWLEGGVGELEGVARLLGGGMTKVRGSI